MLENKIININMGKKLSDLFNKEWAFTTTDEFLEDIKEENKLKLVEKDNG